MIRFLTFGFFFFLLRRTPLPILALGVLLALVYADDIPFLRSMLP